MKLLSVSHFFASHGGGIELVAGHLAEEFAQAGHGSTWLASGDPGDAGGIVDRQRLPCINPAEALLGLPMPIPGPGALRLLARAVAKADAVIIHDCLYLTSIAAFVLARRHGKPVILIQHIAEIPFRSALLRGVMRLANRMVTTPMLRSADQVVFISETVRLAFSALDLNPAPRMLFNGVDTALFHAGAESRAALGLPDGQRIAVFAGRLVEKKGLAVIEALARRRGDLLFVLAGAGPIDPAKWNLPNVHCLGKVSQERLAALYRAADVMILPSVGEGYPLVIQEAMASGLPVICAEESAQADPGATRFLTGVTIDPADPAETAARIDPLLDQAISQTDRTAMAAYTRGTYSWSAMADALIGMAKIRIHR